MSWRSIDAAAPWFGAYRRWLDVLAAAPVATVDELDRRLRAGLAVAAVTLIDATTAPAAYELAIADHGVVPTRAGDAHDLWNAIVWATWPRSKRALTARLAAYQRPRYAAGGKLPGRREPAHDRLALFDEGGVVAVGDRALVFGHAILEHAARGHTAVRAAVWRLSPTVPWHATAIDVALAAAIAGGAGPDPGPGIAIDPAWLEPAPATSA